MDSLVRRQTLGDLLRRSAARNPHKRAVICGDVSWTYAEFNAIVDRLAAGLSQRGVAKGERVAILARNSHAFAALRFALARLGAVLVPINFMLKAEEIAYILGTPARGCSPPTAALPQPRAPQKRSVPAVEQLIWLPSEDAERTPGRTCSISTSLPRARCRCPTVMLDGSDLAQIVYTSAPNRCRRARC